MNLRLRKIIFIILSSLIIFLFVLEISLRIGGYLYTQHRHHEAYLKAKISMQGTFKIFCYGDSFTEGFGVNPQDSYPEQLGLLLQKKGFKNIVVLNKGHCGSSSSLVFRKLQKDIQQYYPDAVIVMIGANNIWNLEKSSYFILRGKQLGILMKASSILDNSKVYKLLKIININFRSKINKFAKKEIEENGSCKSSYSVHLQLADLFNANKDFKLARYEIWAAVKAVDEWDESMVCAIFDKINHFDNIIVNKEIELIRFNRYIQRKYKDDKNKSKKFTDMISARLDSEKNKEIFDNVLRYDLKEMFKLTKENGARFILMTYPNYTGVNSNSDIREISKAYNILLIDNEIIVEEKVRDDNIKDLFLDDGHCNEKGNRLIAEITCDALVKAGIVPNNKIAEKRQ